MTTAQLTFLLKEIKRKPCTKKNAIYQNVIERCLYMPHSPDVEFLKPELDEIAKKFSVSESG